MLAIALPMLLAVSAVGLLFEKIPLLRGITGKIAFFFLFGGTIGSSMDQGVFVGLRTLMAGMMEAARAFDPSYAGQYEIGIQFSDSFRNSKTFVWEGIQWSLPAVLENGIWIAAAILFTLMSSLLF